MERGFSRIGRIDADFFIDLSAKIRKICVNPRPISLFLQTPSDKTSEIEPIKKGVKKAS
jgi:hypothetical protein